MVSAQCLPTSKPATSKGDGRPVLGLEQSRSVPMERTTFPDPMPRGGCILFKLRACCVVSQDCHNQLPQTGGLKQQQLTFHSSGGRNPRFWLGTLFFGLQTAAFSLCPHLVFLSVLRSWEEGEKEGKGELSGVSYKDTNPMGLGPHPYDAI